MSQLSRNKPVASVPLNRDRRDVLRLLRTSDLCVPQGLQRLALLWQILSDAGFPNQFFCDSWVVGFGRGRPWLRGFEVDLSNNLYELWNRLSSGSYFPVGLARRAWALAQAVSGSPGPQGAATDVSALRVGSDRSWRSQEHSADGEAACTRRLRLIAPLHR